MASAKDTFEPDHFAAKSFACGTFRGIGADLGEIIRGFMQLPQSIEGVMKRAQSIAGFMQIDQDPKQPKER